MKGTCEQIPFHFFLKFMMLGLGGDSIYNRFDNIYVLKLVESSIRNGVQRVDVTHMKGEETKRMVLSEFKMEQMSLFEMMEE